MVICSTYFDAIFYRRVSFANTCSTTELVPTLERRSRVNPFNVGMVAVKFKKDSFDRNRKKVESPFL